MPHQDEIRRLIVNHQRRLQILKEQQALMGLSVDPRIPLEIEDIEATIDKLQIKLEPGSADKTALPLQTDLITFSHLNQKVQAASSLAEDKETFRYDVYISYVDQEPDTTWVWNTLVPRLENANLRIAISGDTEAPGVAKVVNIEQGIEQAKRTVIILSEAYITNHLALFENVVAQTMGIQEGTYRLLPVKIMPIDDNQLPTRLSMITSLNLSHPHRAEREFNRLLEALKSSLPRYR